MVWRRTVSASGNELNLGFVSETQILEDCRVINR